jgi:hypothetical protein
MKMQIALTCAFLTCVPASALAQSQEEQSACINDAFSVCGHAIPDRERVAACLADNINRISMACRTVMARYPKPQPNSRRYTDRRYGNEPGASSESRWAEEPRYRAERRFNGDPWQANQPGYWNEPRYDTMR